LIDGQVKKPFSMRTILDETPAKEKSWQGRVEVVEVEVWERQQ
jgi:hypothetical protein